MSKMHHTNRGKWSHPGVPHRGWECIGIEDLGEPLSICEMCECIDIRYVHYMKHPEYPERLGVGCVCAEHMEENYVRPKQREQTIIRRRKWVQRKWRNSAKGNIFLNTEGYNLVIFAKVERRGKRWRIRVAKRGTNLFKFGKKSYISVEEAKSAALDALIWAKQHLR